MGLLTDTLGRAGGRGAENCALKKAKSKRGLKERGGWQQWGGISGKGSAGEAQGCGGMKSNGKSGGERF